MDCKFPTCTRNAESNGMCLFHQMYANSVEVKPVKEINKESATEKKKKKSRKVRYKEFIAKNPKCKAKFSKQCAKVASVIHHLKGRSPNVVDDERFWMACCPICNGEIESRHAEAVAQGLKIPQHTKQ